MITFTAKIKDLQAMLKGNYLLQLDCSLSKEAVEQLQELKDSKLRINLMRDKERRSIDANAYFHVLVNEIAQVLDISASECKINLNLEYGTIAKDNAGNDVVVKLPASVDIRSYYEYAKWIGSKKEKGLKLNYYVFYKQTHTLDSSEMSKLIKGVVAEAQGLGIDTRTPQEIANMISLWESGGVKIG